MLKLVKRNKEGVIAKNRITSGVLGFDDLVYGGFRDNSVNIIIADPGCGKSTFCWQFCAEDPKRPALYVSLEQTLKSILQDCRGLGLGGFEKKLNKGTLQFQIAFDEESERTAGEIGLHFFLTELPRYLEVVKETASDYFGGIRVAIDPLTPLLLEIPDLNLQRNAVTRIFTSLRKIGTSVVTLEKGFGEALARVPLFLCDSIIELEHVGLGGMYNRTLSICKFRGSPHSEMPHPVSFERNKGLVVRESMNS